MVLLDSTFLIILSVSLSLLAREKPIGSKDARSIAKEGPDNIVNEVFYHPKNNTYENNINKINREMRNEK